jgi:hypothetical protein
MPLEFALRPRFKLERPAPAQKRRLRLSPLALPMLAYWLAIAGVTRALIRAAGDDATDADAQSSSTRAAAESDATESDEAAPSPPPTTSNPPLAATQHSFIGAPLEPAFEPPPMLRATFDDVKDERDEEPSKKTATPPPSRAPAASPDPWLALTHAAPQAPKSGLTTTRDDEPSPRPAARDDAREHEPARPREPERDDGRVAALPSCESAALTANQDIDLRSGPGAPDLTRDAFASVLDNGGYLAHCAIPARTALSICAAVQDGKAVGVSVTSEPQSAAINACVRRAVAGLHFPQSARLDVTRTRFEAAH